MFANFIQITINSQDCKHRLLDLNNIGKGDFFVTCEQTRQNIESQTVWGFIFHFKLLSKTTFSNISKNHINGFY